MRQSRYIGLILLATALAGLIFWFDLSVELGVAAGVPYFFVVMLGFWAPDNRFVLVAAVGTSLLTLFGLKLSPSGGEEWQAFYNRMLILLEIWGCAIFSMVYRGSKGRLLQMRDRLNQKARNQENRLEQLDALQNLVFEGMEEGIAGLDMEGRITFVNPSVSTMLGYSRGELMGKYWHNLVHHSHPDGSPYPRSECPPLVSLFDGKTHRAAKDVLWRKGGTQIQVRMVCKPLLDESKVTGVIVVFQDITRQLISQQKFEGCDLWLRVILNNTFEGILTINEEGVIEMFNPAAERLFGYRELEVMGKNVKILLAEPYRSDPNYFFNHYLETGKYEPVKKQVELKGRRKDGKEFPLLLGVNEFVFDSRKHLVATINDFTDRKQFEQRLRDQQAFLEKVNGKLVVENEKRREVEKKLKFAMGSLRKKNQELDQFASIVSHDLKAPLRSIYSLANWVEDEFKNEPKKEVRRYTQLMKKRIDRLVNLIDGILEYSRAGRNQGSSNLVDLQTLLCESLELSPPPSEFTIEIAPDLPPVFGDRTQLLQVFSNLVQNAVYHHDRKNGRIRISWGARENAYEFCVEDDGPGIEDKYRDQVFKIFNTMGKKAGNASHGLGLALVRKIVETQGGTVWIESVQPRGAAFWFTWPQSAPEPVLALD